MRDVSWSTSEDEFGVCVLSDGRAVRVDGLLTDELPFYSHGILVARNIVHNFY